MRREGFLRSLAAFVVPAGAVSAATIGAAYLAARGPLDLGLEQSRGVVAALAATLVGLGIVLQVERGVERRRIRRWVWGMVAAFLVSIPVGLSIPWLREFFALPWPEPSAWGAAIGCAAVGVVLLEVVRRIPLLARIEEPPVPERPAGDRS